MHKREPWWRRRLTIRTRRDCKTTCAKWLKKNIDNVLLLGKVVLWVEEGNLLLFSLHWKHDELSTYPSNICYSELRHMQPLLSSCLLCFFHLTWFPPSDFQRISSLTMNGVLNMSKEHQYSTLKSWVWSLLDCRSHLALPPYHCRYSYNLNNCVSLPVTETEMKCPDPFISKDLLPSHRVSLTDP